MSAATNTGMQKAGGIASLLIAASYVFGFGLFFGFFEYAGYDGPAGNMAFMIDHQSLLSLAMITLYIIPGCLLVVLGIALHHRLAVAAGPIMQITTSFALVWAAIVIASGMIGLTGMQTIAGIADVFPSEAASAWIAISVIQDALGGGTELVGGIWVLMIGWLGLRTGQLPRFLSWFSLFVGITGLMTVIPGLTDLVDVFGLSQIVWYCWLGVIIIRLPDVEQPRAG